MSGARTHMLIGAVGGLALVRSLPTLPALATLATTTAPGWPRTLLDAALVLGSAILATWPDIDEPGSWIAQRVRGLVVVLAALLGLGLGWLLPIPGWTLPPLGRAAVGMIAGGLLIGPLLARLGLRLIRRGAGGHRRLTHSLVLGLALGGATWWSAQTGLAAAALVLGAMAWGQFLHLIGDVVTPAGVPLLWPLASQPWGLPRPIARYGEALVTLAALGLGWMLVA